MMHGIPPNLPVGAMEQTAIQSRLNEPARPAPTSPPSGSVQTSSDYDVSISAEGQQKSAEMQSSDAEPTNRQKLRSHINGDNSLTRSEEQEVSDLKQRDAEVRAHERAHQAVGGRYVGAMNFEYESGPDNRRYAVGGEVSVDLSKVPNNPEATVQKMQVIKRAALAPRDPSSQDHSVHAQASQIEMESRREAQAMKAEEARENSSTKETEPQGAAPEREAASTENGSGPSRPEPTGFSAYSNPATSAIPSGMLRSTTA